MTKIYAAFGEMFLRSSRNGVVTRASDLDGRSLECVGVHPAEPRRVLVGTFESGLYRSTDGGETFQSIEGFDGKAVMSVAFAPDDPDEVWIGTEPSRVYRSLDGGHSWEVLGGLVDLPSSDEWAFPPRPHTHHVRWIEPDPVDPDHWYIAIEAGALVQTHDRGKTWEDRVTGARRDNHSLATHETAPGRAWVAAGDGYAETKDGGESWVYPQEGLEHRYVWSVAVGTGGPDPVLVSSAQGARTAHNPDRADSYVYRRYSGDDWQRLDGRGLPMGEGVTRAVLERAPTEDAFYALNNRGLFRTADTGDSWERIELEAVDVPRATTARGLAVV